VIACLWRGGHIYGSTMAVIMATRMAVIATRRSQNDPTGSGRIFTNRLERIKSVSNIYNADLSNTFNYNNSCVHDNMYGR
jgi:hypothetical protein